MTPKFLDIVSQKRILVCAGSGGVGKTTTAAALALQGAHEGKKTLVLTIDPAKRLANSLGLPRLDHEIRRVPDEMLTEAGLGRGGSLHAMMLDQKRTFDEVVDRYASSAEVKERVLKNPIYRQISTYLTGSHEYAAMAKLCEIAQESDYELIVVDTPPTAHALDFLDAPQKVSEAVDSPAIQWFVKPFKATGRFSMKVIGMSGTFVLKRVARFVGSDFLEDMARFFVEAGDVLRGFNERGREVQELLQQPEVGFVLVTAPEPTSIEEALFFHERLMTTRMPFVGFVVNRVHHADGDAPPAPQVAKRLGARPECEPFAPYELRRAADGMVTSHGEIGTLARADRAEIARLESVLRPGEALAQVPFFDQDIHDVHGLVALGRHLSS